MARIKCLLQISEIFKFKTVFDNEGYEYILFEQSGFGNNLQIADIEDKTAFEASENHIHLLDRITKPEFQELLPIAQTFGTSVLCKLKSDYPDKRFAVFASIRLHDSFIIRFHQIHNQEALFCNPNDFTDNERVFGFYG